MIHEAYMPVYMGPRFSLHTGSPEVGQEALADLKKLLDKYARKVFALNYIYKIIFTK